jgi:5'-3' exonuclease
MKSLFRNAGAHEPAQPGKRTIVAFDASYCVFHRHHAMRRFERMAGIRSAELDPGPATEDDLIAFGDSLRQTLVSQTRLHGATDVVLMMDCPRADIWRRDTHAEYKATRATPGDMPQNLFPHFYEVVAPAMVSDLGYKAIACPRAEADDVAAVLADWAVENDADLVIVTGDADLAQLCRPCVRVVDLKGECVLKKACAKAGCELDAGKYLALKLLVGDKGDNIPAIRPRMGPKTALKAVDALEAELSDPNVRARYEHNKLMMDLSMTPPDIRAAIRASIDQSLPKLDHGPQDIHESQGLLQDLQELTLQPSEPRQGVEGGGDAPFWLKREEGEG